MQSGIISILAFLGIVGSQKDPHFVNNRTTIVQLFEWKWVDIARECEIFLQHKGYGGVQISPANENLVIRNRPWYERYQPVSYRLITRSGNEDDFKDMTIRCNNVGIRIYADVVINHMTNRDGVGTAGSPASATTKTYPSVPYRNKNFHQYPKLNNYSDVFVIRNWELEGLRDLDHSQEYVRTKIVDYMNHLIDLGVAGFRVDAAKHMTPADLKLIYEKVKNLNPAFGFPLDAKPFIYQEVIDNGGDVISRDEYISFGAVLDFRYGGSLGTVFRKEDKLSYLRNWGPKWGLIKKSDDAVVFIDNHDTQRGVDPRILTHKDAKIYKMATAFMLAHPYGTTRVMSSYHFSDKSVGPPQDNENNLISPGFNVDNSCFNGYVCEHRWRQVYNMATFRNIVRDTSMRNWWSDGNHQIAFCRGNVGFVAFTNGGNIHRNLNVCVPPGIYCDIISGDLVNGLCTGKAISVRQDGFAYVTLSETEDDGILAIHIKSRLNIV